MNRVAFFMYHELELPQRALCNADPGYVRYVVPAPMFEAHVARLRARNIRGVSVRDALAGGTPSPSAAITFDDGCETDLLCAAPVLRDAGHGATFYVTVEHLGRRGFLSKGQLRQLAELGFEIGSHAMTHRYLHDLPMAEIRAELVDSKRALEDVTGVSVVQFSCPGGRWDQRVLRVAREAGYDSLVTSAIGLNSPGTDRFLLKRIPVMRGMDATAVAGLAQGEGITRRRAQGAILSAAKGILGNSRYERLRKLALRVGEAGRLRLSRPR
jgi:peptidoglycan/xylan/chitin deacetylase (PgdA/CDA1 family)